MMFVSSSADLRKTVTFGVSAAVEFTMTSESSVLGNPKRKSLTVSVFNKRTLVLSSSVRQLRHLWLTSNRFKHNVHDE